MTEEPKNRLTGFVVLAVAVFILLTALIDRSIQGNRRWLMAAVAAVFSLAGLQLVTQARGRLSALMAGTVCALFSALGLYVAVSGEPLGGGLPFIPGSWNQVVGHALFGFGAVVTGGMSAYYFKEALKRGKSD